MEWESKPAIFRQIRPDIRKNRPEGRLSVVVDKHTIERHILIARIAFTVPLIRLHSVPSISDHNSRSEAFVLRIVEHGTDFRNPALTGSAPSGSQKNEPCFTT